MGAVEILIKAKDLTAAAFATTKGRLTALKTKVAATKAGFVGLGSKIGGVMSAAIAPIMLVVAAVYAIGKAVGSVTGQFGEFESAMKGVQKTTGLSDEEVDALGDDFKDLSREVPKSAAELAGIGKIAGQLGIEGTENIKSFTRTVAEASVAFDMDAEAAALGLAALQKIYGTTIPEITNLGSAVNELGNTTGASERQLLEFSTQLGPTAEMLGFTSTEALGMGATLIELKMNASDAGTRLNSAFTIMAQKVPQVSEFLGISEQAFRDAFGEAPLGMLVQIVDKIAEIEDPLEQNTAATRIFGRIGAKAIKGLTKDTGRLIENTNKATKAYEEGTAMHQEYLIFASSYEAQLELIKNKANLAAIAVGEKLAPAILALGTAITDTVIPGLGAFSEEVGKQTSETWPNFTKAVNEAFTKITGGTTFQAMMEGVGTAVGIVLNAILLGLTFIIETNGPFFTAIGGMVTCITEFVSDIKNLSVKEAFENLGKNIVTALGNIKDNIEGLVTPIVNAISVGFGKIKDKVAPIFEGVKDTIFTKLGSIKEGLGETLDPVKTAIHNKLAAIKDGLAAKLEPIKTAVLTALGKIKEGLDPVLSPVKEAIHTKLGAIKDGLEEKLDPVKTAIEGVFTKAASVIETSFSDLPTAIGTIFTTIGTAITAFGKNLPGFLGTGVTDLGAKFTELGDAFTTPAADIKEDIGTVTTELGIVETAIAQAKTKFEEVPASVKGIATATETLKEEVSKDMGQVTIDIDGTKVSFDGLKGKVGDVVTEFGNFESIASELIGLDWSVFTTLKEELPKIDKGIGDMKTAFEGLKTVLDDNVDNLEDIQTDLGDIEKAITPFVNGITPGITAIGNFGNALSSTQSALATFASLEGVDLKGMIGFSTAIHSMVSGLKILDGQIEYLVPSFDDMSSLIHTITDTFVYSGKKGGRAMGVLQSGISLSTKKLNDMGVTSEDLFDAMNSGWKQASQAAPYYKEINNLAHAYIYVTGEVLDYNEAYKILALSEEDQLKWADDLLHSSKTVEYQLDKETDALKHQNEQLTKISDAIQPLIGFMETLGDLFDISIGEKAFASDLVTLQEVFAAVEETLVNLAVTLQTVDLGTPIKQLITDSKGFRMAMEENGGELAVLMTFVDTLLQYYADLGETMAELSGIQEELGDGGLDLGVAFGNIESYIVGLTTFTPQLATALADLKTVWDENSGAINGGISAFNEVMAAITNVEVYMGKWIAAENDAKTATEEATAAVAAEADELAGHSLTTSLGEAQASTVLFKGVTEALRGAIDSLVPAVSAAASVISGNLVSAIGSAVGAMASFAGSAYSWGSSIAYSFADGIYSGIGAVESAASALANVVSSYIGVHSNTELGALSRLEDWGPAIVRTVGEGMRGERVGLNKALNEISLGGISMGSVAASSGGGGGSKTVNLTFNQTISNRSDAEHVITEVTRLMKKPALI